MAKYIGKLTTRRSEELNFHYFLIALKTSLTIGVTILFKLPINNNSTLFLNGIRINMIVFYFLKTIKMSYFQNIIILLIMLTQSMFKLISA